MASICGRPLHVTSRPQSTLSIFRGCGKNKAQPAAALTGPWKSSQKLRFIRSHLGHLHLPASTSQPAAVPSLGTPYTPPQKKKIKVISPELLASCRWVGYDFPGKGCHVEGTLEEVARPGPPRWCLPLAPSDFKPGTPPGLVMKSPSIYHQCLLVLPPPKDFTPRETASPTSSSLPQFFCSESPMHHRQALRLHTWSTQYERHHGT